MKTDQLWAIVLAGGEGTRLASTTRALYGHSLPKQFASFGQPRTFLQATVDRLLPLLPPERIVVVVSASFEELARLQLQEFEGIEIVPQPRNAGTGPGVMLPLAHVLRRAPEADVALVPSDHDFRRPTALRAALQRGQQACRSLSSGVVLLGAQAEHPATDLGWMLPGDALPEGGQQLLGFVEKPKRPEAERLHRQGALWNTMLSVARARALWQLACDALPDHAAAFQPYLTQAGTAMGRSALERLYEQLPAADYSRDVLGSARGLGLVELHDSGWSDCGTPERLQAALGHSMRRSGVYPKGSWERSPARSAACGAEASRMSARA